MREEIIIPRRLKTISSYLSLGTIFADIGSDHAFLPVYVCLHDPSAYAIAGEVNQGPYERAIETVNKYHLNNVVDVRLGDGLAIVQPGEINELVIAGMGGTLISSILEEGKKKLSLVKKIIVQPNIQARKVRQWLEKNNYLITDETIIKENNHFYEIIVSKSSNSSRKKLPKEAREKEYIFGPILLQNKTPQFHQKWTEEKIKLEKIINQMKRARVSDDSKIKQFEKELTWIEEVLS